MIADCDREIFVENFDQKHAKVYNLPQLPIISNTHNIVDNPFGEDTNDEDAFHLNNTSKAKQLSISILILLAFLKKVLNINGKVTLILLIIIN